MKKQMQSPPPENAKPITPGQIIATKHAIGKFVKKRAQELTSNKIGWWGERAVVYALWLYLEDVIATSPAEKLEDAVHHHLTHN